MKEKTMLAKQIESLCEGVANPISNLANVSALLWQEFPNINWAGFYIWTNGRLGLGPFQGQARLHGHPGGKRGLRNGGGGEPDGPGGGCTRISWTYRLRQRFPVGDRRSHSEKRESLGRSGYGQPGKRPVFGGRCGNSGGSGPDFGEYLVSLLTK